VPFLKFHAIYENPSRHISVPHHTVWEPLTYQVETMPKKVENEKNVKKFLYKQAWRKMMMKSKLQDMMHLKYWNARKSHCAVYYWWWVSGKRAASIIKLKSSWAKKSEGIYFFKLHVCIHTFFSIQQSHDVVLPSRMMKGAPWEKSHFFFLLTILFYFFCVWRYNNNKKRSSSSKKNCSWVVRFGWGRNGSVW
jgi:hypothetical protein